MDAALFRELGERLVGKPHIALAELIKNSYDADATHVSVRFERDRIEISDDGNGMTPEEFRGFWMRVGSPHKQDERRSPVLDRPLTGSKGVGRLAAQFLARGLELRTTARKRGAPELRASVDWTDVVRAGDMTKATVVYEEMEASGTYASGSKHGTIIVLTHLHHKWTAEELSDLAREIWWLQPPFHAEGPKAARQNAFEIRLEHQAKSAAREFEERMRAALDGWYARITGRLLRPTGRGARAGRVSVTLEFEGGERHETSFEVPDCAIAETDFEIRVYNLTNRQRNGVRVEEARRYFKQFGGVHVYDAGFHLPYYGPDTDWLRIEIDHSHRLSRSQLLPSALQVSNGLNNLPTQSRLFGVVHVDTAAERDVGLEAHRRDYLKIQVSRDRLVDNLALEQLRDAVRWTLDYYAMQETRRKLRETERRRPVEPAHKKVERVGEVLERHRSRMPKRAFDALRAQVTDAVAATESEAEAVVRRMGLLGALATAGTAALAYDQQAGRELDGLDTLARRLEQAADGRPTREEFAVAAQELREWVKRAREARGLLSHVATEESRATRARFRARSVIEDVRDHMRVLFPAGTSVEATGVDASLRLPPGTLAEWSAIFQNVLSNAGVAVLGAKVKEIVVSSRADGRTRTILMQDTGSGVDLKSAEKLFEPFERGRLAGTDRGAGLGLTVVRMIAENLRCRVGFVAPDEGFSTAFQLSWTEGA